MFTYENQNTNSYMIYTLEANEELDTVTLGMLTNNAIPGLAPTTYFQVDTDKRLRYDITSKVTAKDFLNREINKRAILAYLESITDALLSVSDYMINIDTVLLDTDKIFVDVSKGEASLICLPVISDDLTNFDYHAYFKNLIYNIKFNTNEDTVYIARLMNYLNGGSFTLVGLNDLVHSLREERGGAPARPVQPQPAPQPTVPHVEEHVAPAPAPQPAPQPAAPPVQPQPARPAQPQPQVPHQQVPPVQPQRGGQAAGGFQIPGQKPAQPQVPGRQPAQPQRGGQAAGGFQIPGQNTTQPQVPGQQPAADPNAPKMSLGYLLNHYNKENAAIYKQQKAQQKANKGAAAPAPAPAPKKAGKKGKGGAPGFEMPGQAGPAIQQPGRPPVQPQAGRPIPPQPARPQQPGGFQMPGQGAPAVQPQQPNPMQGRTPIQQPGGNAVPNVQGMDFGETVVLGGSLSGETVVLSGAAQQAALMPYLIRKKTNERIPINKGVFRLGKERSYVDYCVSDNSAVSRSHAQVLTQDGKYYIVDTNSTNHTYLNGQMIPSNSQVEITSGAKIALGNEEFEFRMM